MDPTQQHLVRIQRHVQLYRTGLMKTVRIHSRTTAGVLDRGIQTVGRGDCAGKDTGDTVSIR